MSDAQFCICYSIRSSNKMHGSPSLRRNPIKIKYVVWELAWYEKFGLSTCNSFQGTVYSLIVPISSGEGLAENKDRLAGGSQSQPFIPERQSLATQTFAAGFAVQHLSLAKRHNPNFIKFSPSTLVRPCSDKAKLT